MQSGDARANNLFSRLFSYTPREGRIPLEDYCTEALAWCLCRSEDVVQKFLALTGIEELRGYRGPIAVATQQSFKGSGDEDDEEEDGQSSGGRFDLVIRPAHSSSFVLVVESKAFSGFCPCQLPTYRRQLNEGHRFKDVPKDKRFLVALTDHAVTQPLDQAGGRLRWSGVCHVLEQQIAPEPPNSGTRAETRSKNICQQFATFLKEKGMSLELPKGNPDIQNHVKGLLFRQEIERVLEKVRQMNPQLKNALKRSPEFNHDPVSGTTWLGVFSRPSRPSLYIGFRLTMDGQPAYSMPVETQWPNESPERTAFKKNLEREYPGQVEDEDEWITLRQQMTADYDGQAEKVVTWLGQTATRMIQLLKGSKAGRGGS